MKQHVKQRILWGVTLRGPLSPEHLLYEPWNSPRRAAYPGEPTRALVFQTRAKARAWAKHQQASYRNYPLGSVVRDWHFRAVRVTELLLWGVR
jgi:hypothetical protein